MTKTSNHLLTELLFSEAIPEPKRKVPTDVQTLGIQLGGGIDNILRVYNEATTAEREFWGSWYKLAHLDVRELADKYQLPFPVMAAIVAVLSPGNKWTMNVMAADRLLDSYVDFEGHRKGIPGYPKQITRAERILQTGDVGLVTGPKVTVFFKSLLDPSSVERDLVLDGHAINIWRGQKMGLKSISMPNKTERVKMVQDYQSAAEMLGVPVQAVQAVTWYIWKYTTDAPVVKHRVFDTSKFPGNTSVLAEVATTGFERVTSKFEELFASRQRRGVGDEEYLEEARALGQKLGLKELGSGVSRIVFLLSRHIVLKVQIEHVLRSYTQNEQEVGAVKCLGSEFTPRIYGYDPKNYSWIIAERVDGLRTVDELDVALEHVLGFSSDDIAGFAPLLVEPEYLTVLFQRSFTDKKLQDWFKQHSSWYKRLVPALRRCKVGTWDFHARNFGIRDTTGELVMLDVGVNG